MIPEFPNFKKINKEDREEIELHTHKNLPYSDFNFNSLWSWDTSEKRAVSILNENLVVYFTNYETGEPVLSFMGTNKVIPTVQQIIKFAEDSKILSTLYFVPEESADNLKGANFLVEEDRDNFDYILSIPKLIDLDGLSFKKIRASFNRFIRENPKANFEVKKINDPDIQEQIKNLFYLWVTSKKEFNTSDLEHEQEEIAIKRLVQMENDRIVASCVFLDNKMIAFSIDELLPSGYAISHFTKADSSYKGVYDFLNIKTAQYLNDQNISLWNWEQDLGIPNLKSSKMAYRPTTFLKKYKVSVNKEN